MEEELAAKLEIIEKLRIQVKELEREKRDAIRRYNEQTTTFEAERQTFYDSEQHLKSRIQSLSQARRPSSPRRSPSIASKDLDDQDEAITATSPSQTSRTEDPTPTEGEESEPAEMTALRLELTTLSTSHGSMQNTLHLLQTQLNDLKRVNHELQEENESYNILLRERTLNGQFDILRATAVGHSRDDDDDEVASSPVDEKNLEREGRSRSVHARSTLDVVLEHDEIHGPAAALRREESPASRHSKRSRRGGPRNSSPITRGESLADLPVAGPGLDLAAELGRAENKDILENNTEPAGQINRSAQAVDHAEVQALRSEVKALKDANKALSLYASKIIDRIISQEGFEHVLAVDYDASKKDKSKDVPVAEKPKPASKPRPRSSFFSSMSVQEDRPPKLLESTPPAMNRATSESTFSGASSSAMAVTSSAPLPSPSPATNPPTPNVSTESAADKRTRRTLSMDWKGITNLFGGGSSASPAEVKTDKLRPLTLRAGTSINGQGPTSVPSSTSFARKVETIEDENDRRERERMLATMKLMGIENPSVASPSPPLAKSTSSVSPTPTPPEAPTPPPSNFFTRLRSSEAVPQVPAAPLTAEALERAEAESSIAALDAKEKNLTAEYAKGKSASTFTELNGGRLSDGYRKKSSQKSASGGGRGRVSIDVGDDGSNHSRAGSVNTLFSAGTME